MKTLKGYGIGAHDTRSQSRVDTAVGSSRRFHEAGRALGLELESVSGT